MKNYFLVASLFVMLIGFIGCGGGGTASHQPVEDEDSKREAPNVVAPTETNSRSPAFKAGLPVANDATPGEVVIAFLASLQSGDDLRAAALLTDKAREETERENLSVQPPGSPSAKYTVGEVRYVSDKKQGAHVSSVWTETDDAGVAESYEITWILRRQTRNGWRIAGMATAVFPDEPPIILNFENPKEMLAQWQRANTDLAERNEAGSGIRQAKNAADKSGIR